MSAAAKAPESPAVDSEADDVHEVPHVNGAAPDLTEDEFPETELDALDGDDPHVRVDDADGWRERLITSTVSLGEGKFVTVVQKTLPNVITILRFHPKWRGVLAFNAFSERIVTTRTPPWDPAAAPEKPEAGAWQETDSGRTVDWLARNEKLTVKSGMVLEAAAIVAESKRVHPVQDYLQSVKPKWDRKQRLATWLEDYCGAAPSVYASEVGRRWMISAVARAFRPGCQVDCMLILESKEQGTGKSSAFRALVPSSDLYSETGVTIGDKDSYQALHGVWIYLFDELDSLKRGDITKTKNFISSPKDHFRPSYGRVARDFLRQNVFAGSTNEIEYFVDRRNRRFWPVRVTRAIDVEAIIRDRDQLWAEAVVRFESGERWHVDAPELRALCDAQQLDRVQGDALEIIVARWLEDPYEIRWEDDESITGKPVRRKVREPYDASNGVLTTDILLHALEKPSKDITSGDHQRIARVLDGLGYERQPQTREAGARVNRWTEPPSQEKQT